MLRTEGYFKFQKSNLERLYFIKNTEYAIFQTASTLNLAAFGSWELPVCLLLGQRA